MPYRFQPPRENRAVIALVNLCFPVFLPVHDAVVRVSIDEREWERLAALRGGRALLLPNHPSETEPVIMGWLARKLGEPFNYLATHEMFEGVRGWVCNRMGAFTIRRGWPDRASIRTAVGQLAERDRKLVVFPEGETHMENDRILTLHEGAVQIAFWALQRLQELGKPLRLPVVPVVIRYRCAGDPRPPLLRGLARLERQLGLRPGRDGTPADRLRAAGMVVLDGIEREYGLQARTGAPGSVNERIGALYRHITERVARVLHAPPRGEEEVHVGMRALFNAAFDYLDLLANEDTAYERRLHERRVAAAKACLNDLWRIQNFMVISEECLAPPVAVERAGELLWRLEIEAFGRGRTRPWREAVVRIGEPIELGERYEEYRAGRRAARTGCTAEVETRLRGLLESVSLSGRLL